MRSEELQDVRSEAPDRTLFDGDQRFMASGQSPDQVMVKRLGEAGVGDRRRKAHSVEVFGGL